MLDSKFWQGKRVFLTGHTGFKGGWLALWLQELGAEVTGYSLEPQSTPSLFVEASIGEECHSLIGDIRDHEGLLAAVKNCNPDVVLHLAAQALVRDSYDDPRETYSTNVMGTLNLLEAVRAVNAEAITLIVTTDKCYENKGWVWGYRENDELGGHDLYSSSKACAEILTSSYRRSFPQMSRMATARAGNVIGGGDWAKDRLVPDIVRAFEKGEAVELRNPKATRPWQHVLEPLSGYLQVCEALGSEVQGADSPWNFGPDGIASVAEVTDHLTGQWEEASWKDVSSQGDGGKAEARVLQLDSSKAKGDLSWQPKLSLAEACAWTGQWYREHGQGACAKSLCRMQIEKYSGAQKSS